MKSIKIIILSLIAILNFSNLICQANNLTSCFWLSDNFWVEDVHETKDTYYCKELFNSSNIDYNIHFEKNRIYFYRFIAESTEEVTTEYLFDCFYLTSEDTLILRHLKLNDIRFDTLFYYFRIIEDGILESLSDIQKVCKKGDIFYCHKYKYDYIYDNNVLLGGVKSWRNGKKDGEWIYIDSLWNVYNFIYKDNVIIEKKLVPKSNKLE